MATTHVFTLNDVYRQSLEGTWVAQSWNAVWFGAGYGDAGQISSIERVIFASDTATAVVKGRLSGGKYLHAAHGSPSDAWYGGGAYISTVDRIIFASDTATAVVKGSLSTSSKRGVAAHGNETDAWFGGGMSSPISIVDRVIFSADTATAVAKGPLSAARYAGAASGNTTDAWFGGGNTGSIVSIVDRIIFSADTATAVAKGPLSVARYFIGAAHGSPTNGWYGGGGLGPSPSLLSRVDRIIFASDTATAVVKGSLTETKHALAAGGNTTDAWFGSGYNSVGPGNTSIVNRIIFASDTATAVARGPLSLGRHGSAAN